MLVTLPLRECPRHDLWLDGKAMRTGHLKPGMINVYDLRSNPIVNSVSTFEPARRLVTEMIDEKLSGSMNIGDLANACDLSIDVFRRAFFNSFGMIPHQLLMKRRLGRGSLLLRRTELPLSDIATSCGFASARHLVRAV